MFCAVSLGRVDLPTLTLRRPNKTRRRGGAHRRALGTRERLWDHPKGNAVGAGSVFVRSLYSV